MTYSLLTLPCRLHILYRLYLRLLHQLLPTPTHSYPLSPTLTYQVRFISKLETGYKSRDDVPFHNRSHAADVVHGTAYFLNQAPLTTSNPYP